MYVSELHTTVNQILHNMFLGYFQFFPSLWFKFCQMYILQDFILNEFYIIVLIVYTLCKM